MNPGGTMAKKVEGRSDLLLACAMAEFMEMGFQEASLRVIAAKADTTTGSIYSRFQDKEGLFHALVDDTVEQLLTWVKHISRSSLKRMLRNRRAKCFPTSRKCGNRWWNTSMTTGMCSGS